MLPVTTPEPEYVDINSADQAVVTLQENNHLVIVDLAEGAVIAHFSAGTNDIYATDILENDLVEANGVLTEVPREPDAVSWIDDERFVTANEGDYEGGSRGYTVFDLEGNILHDSGNLMEYLAMLHGQYPEFRAENKGVEPEGVDVGTYGEGPLDLRQLRAWQLRQRPSWTTDPKRHLPTSNSCPRPWAPRVFWPSPSATCWLWPARSMSMTTGCAPRLPSTSAMPLLHPIRNWPPASTCKPGSR